MNRMTHAPRERFAITSRTLLALGLAALVAMPACSETEVVENLHLRISSEAPTGGGSLENLGILLAKGDTRYPATLAEPAFNPSLAGRDITNEPVLVSLQYDGQTFGGGDGVTLQVVGRTGQVVRTRFEGVVDLGDDEIITVRLTNLPATCDGDGDGFLDCSNSACCPANSPFGDCDDGEIASNPWASAPTCIPCGSSIDYDCDGQVEACVDADDDTVADCEEICGQGDPTVAPGLPEKCDDKDNDCDGSTDEGFELGGVQIGGACTAPGNCGAGVVECRTEDTTTCSSGPDGSDSKVEDEVCDGGDNDCDGSTDEGFVYEGASVGAACDGRGECGAGLVECAVFRTDLATCSTNPDGTEHSFATEVCNDLDDDCDGETDDGLTLADSDCKKVGVCATGTVATCDGSSWSCDYGAVANYQEVETLCDGLDNDCDGETDEGFLYEGAAVGESCDGIGACGEGTVECEAGRTDRATCSTNPGGSDFLVGGEICDGLDNDCNGQTDEGFSYLGADIGEACDGVGLCGVGVVACAVGRTDRATCSTNPDGAASQVVAETCDNQDNDCDGTIDDGLGLVDSTCSVAGVCGAAAGQIVATCTNGQWACDYSNVPQYQANETRCDGRDNDCDGSTDEGFLYEGSTLGQACDGVGQCGAGVVQCAVGREDLATCSTNPDGSASQGQDESCDSLDNDCDGQTDEAFLYLGTPVGQACDGIGACGSGLVECLTTSSATCSTNPNGSNPDTSPETCNALDDDCDGSTDEGLTLADSTCTTVGVCAPALASIVATCTAQGTWSCNYAAVPNHQAVETACDSLDNDCDGETDEPFKAGGSVTYTDPQYPVDSNLVLGASCGTGRCSGGAVICNPGDPNTMVCDRVVQNRRTEVCDNIDDDCDGSTDETFTSLATAILPADVGKAKGQSCGTGACAGGTVVCNGAGTALVCGSETNASNEVCDGDDDDCDGNTDEGFPNIDGDEFVDCVDACIDGDFDTICTNENFPLCVGGINTGCRDNCPTIGNTNQQDADRDGKGDVCDTACPNGPGPFEVCGDCLDNDCSNTVDEASCAERRVITIAARGEPLPAGYPVKLVLDHKTLVDAGWSTTSGDDVRIFYRDPTLSCDDTDPFSCSVELDRIADPLTPFNDHATEIWFALQAPLPANTATTQYELYYNVTSMFEPLEDETAIFHMADFFERADSNTLGLGWVEDNQAVTDFAIENGELDANYNDDGTFTPIVTKGFDPISAASEIGRFELRLGYDWVRTNEGSWAVLMQLGKASNFAAMPDQDNRWPNAGVGVSLAHGGGAAMGGQPVNTLASVTNGISTATGFTSRATVSSATELYITIDLRDTPGWQVAAGAQAGEDLLIPFATAQTELDTLRFILNGVSNGFSAKGWRHVLLRPAVDPGDEPSVYLGIEEPLGSGLASCTLPTATVKYRMDGLTANPITNNLIDAGSGTALNLPRSQDGGSPVFVELLSHWAARFSVRGNDGRYLSSSQGSSTKLASEVHGRNQVTWEVVVDNNDTASSGSTPYWMALAANADHLQCFGLAFTDRDTIQAIVRTAAGTSVTWTWDVPPLAQSRRAVLHLVFDSTRSTASERLRLYYDGALRAPATSPTISQNANLYIYSGSGGGPQNQGLLAVGNATSSNPDRSPLADLYWFASYPQALSADDVRKHTRILSKSDDKP